MVLLIALLLAQTPVAVVNQPTITMPGDRAIGSATLSTACVATIACSATAALPMQMVGAQAAEIKISSTTAVGATIVCDASEDGTNFTFTKCLFRRTDPVATTGFLASSLTGSLITAGATYQLLWEGVPQYLRVRISAITSGSVVVFARVGSGAPQYPAWLGHVTSTGGMPADPYGNAVGIPILYGDAENFYAPLTMKGNGSGPSLAIPSANVGSSQSEVLVLNSSTALTVPSGTKSCEIFNNGPNTIYCNPAGAAANTSRPIAAGSAWTLDIGATAGANLHCFAATAAQLTTAATVLTCIK